jgi:predicted ATP-grasp superfamily ATP-dependent carboligase
MMSKITYPCDVLVLDGRLRQSLATVRSLGKRGIHVAVLECASCVVPAFSSRWRRYGFTCPAEEGSPGYFDYLMQVLDATHARVVIASSDGTIELLRGHREELEQRTALALAREPALGIAIDKEQTLSIAELLGLAVPRCVLVSNVDEARVALRAIGMPAVIKPTRSWASNERGGARLASKLVMTAYEADQAVEELTCFGGKALVQQFIPGKGEAIGCFYAQGEMLARFAYRVKRTDPPLGGTDVMCQSIAVPADTGGQAERLIREIGLEGYSLVEFRRDRDGRPYLMEINARLSAGVAHAVHVGVDFPYMLYRWASGEKIEPVQGYRTGNWMRYLSGDIATTAASIRQRGRAGVNPPARAVLDFATACFIPAHYDYLECSDPLPVWTATAGWLCGLPKLVGRAFSNGATQQQVRWEEVDALPGEAGRARQEGEEIIHA